MNVEGKSTLGVLWMFVTTPKPAHQTPDKKIPGYRIDLQAVPDETPAVIWFGHSSYLIKYRGKNILVDPVFSGNAAPTSLAVKAFKGADLYTVDDMPPIDLLVLTHDHYDHIDYPTVKKLRGKVQHVLCPLGCGEHLECWGFTPAEFTELDWWEAYTSPQGFRLTAAPTRHFSGRGLERNRTLWASFVLELGSYRLFIGGDSGYDDQFKKIGEKFGPFDLAMLECGQYNENWPYIHMFPEQTAQAARDLGAKMLFPVHWGKFVLSLHSWTDPIERVLKKAAELGQPVTTPMIGEVLRVGEPPPQSVWWR